MFGDDYELHVPFSVAVLKMFIFEFCFLCLVLFISEIYSKLGSLLICIHACTFDPAHVNLQLHRTAEW